MEESSQALGSGCGSSAAAVLSWTKCVYSSDRKNREDESRMRLDSLFQLASGRAMAGRTFQQCRCEQGGTAQSSCLVGTGGQVSTIF